MQYRSLGKTGLQVSVIGMGSEGYVGSTNEKVNELVDVAIKNGINYFDLYNSEPDVRSALGLSISGRREKVIIEGHIGSTWKDGQYERSRDIKRVKEAFEDLLIRLRTDYIDVGMIHYVDAEDDFNIVFNGEFIKYVKDLKAAGKIHHIGMSSHNPVIAKKAIETGIIEVLLFSINPAYDMQPPNEDVEQLWADENYEKPLCNIDPDRASLYEACEAKGVGITVMKAFGGGDMLDAKMSPFQVAMTSLQCIHYALTRPSVATVLGGFREVDEILDACVYCTSDDKEKDYSNVLSGLKKFTHKGKCMYCGHCAPCTVGIDIASVNKYLALCNAQKMVPETVRDHYKALKHHAGECISCGKCEKNCPFNVSIIDKMKEIKEKFGY